MITAEYVRSVLSYDPETGFLHWKYRPIEHFKNAHGMNIFNAQYARKIAGSLNKKGYLTIRIDNILYYSHRLIWLIQTGKWPDPEVDHRDLNKANNRWENLREASDAQQRFNQGKNKNSTSGIKGVYFYEPYQKWRAVIGFKRKTITIGYYFSADEAIAARTKKAQELHGEFSRAA